MSTKELRSAELGGYSAYTVYEDGSVIVKETGKPVKAKKGLISLKSDTGELYEGTQEELAKIVLEGLEGNGSDESGSDLDDEEDDSPESEIETEEETNEAAIKAERTRLVKVIAEITKRLMKCPTSELEKVRAEYDVAEKELQDFKALHGKTAGKAAKKEKVQREILPPSPEQIAAQEAYDAAKKVYDEASTVLDAAKTELKKYKTVRKQYTGNVGGGDHTRKLDYRDAQLIRKDIAGGKMTTAQIAEKYGNSIASVNYINNYLQHKLRRAPEGADMTDEENILLYTPFTPLVNKFYPAEWKHTDGRIFHGAPLKEDGVKESTDRYKLGHYVDLTATNEEDGSDEESSSDLED
jgi:hypothetical protein